MEEQLLVQNEIQLVAVCPLAVCPVAPVDLTVVQQAHEEELQTVDTLEEMVVQAA